MATSDDPDTARIRRRLTQAKRLLELLKSESVSAGVECDDLGDEWEDRINEQWGHQ